MKSWRQFRRLLERYRQEGASGLVSRKRGKSSNNRMPADRESVALGLIREHYADFGPTAGRREAARAPWGGLDFSSGL